MGGGVPFFKTVVFIAFLAISRQIDVTAIAQQIQVHCTKLGGGTFFKTAVFIAFLAISRQIDVTNDNFLIYFFLQVLLVELATI